MPAEYPLLGARRCAGHWRPGGGKVACPTLAACWGKAERQSYHHINKPKIASVKESLPGLSNASEGFLGDKG